MRSANEGDGTWKLSVSAVKIAARALWNAAYDGENGLKEKMLAIKESTRSQYGLQSPQFLQVKGIRV